MSINKFIEPIFILFDGKHEEGFDITNQSRALVHSHVHLILGYGPGVLIPDFGDEFLPPKSWHDYFLAKVERARELYAQRGENPDNITLRVKEEMSASGEPGVMMFYKQKLLEWFTISQKGAMEEYFRQMNRDERRKMEKKIKIPILPLGFSIRRSPQLVSSYNRLLNEFLRVTR